MKDVIAIRTHRWDEDADRLYRQLASLSGFDLVVAFHNRPKDLTLPLPVVDLNDDWLRAQKLQVISDWGWRCGDYFLYAIRAAYPQAKHIWLIEPDVFFTGEPQDFFSLFNKVEDDLLGVKVEPMDAGHRFTRSLTGMKTWRAIFALTRFSAQAADRLLALRQDYATKEVRPRFFANDEAFCFSHAMADPALSVGSMQDHAPDWLAPGQMATDPDILLETVENREEAGVWHPVRGRQSFIRAVGQRAGSQFGFFAAMRGSLAQLSDAERAEIADRVRADCLNSLTHYSRA